MSQNSPSEFLQLWPVTMMVSCLDNHESVNQELISLFRAYQKDHEKDRGEKDRDATAKSTFISADNFSSELKNPAIATLTKFIMDGVYAVSMKLNQRDWSDHKLQALNVDITGMWFQISNDFSFHETHVHGNCSWSGVYYVQAGNASAHSKDTLPNGMLNGVTRFFGPEMEYSAGGHGDWGNYYLHNNGFTSYPKDGTLLIFPSHIKHTAFPYNGEKDRIIVSFNAQVNAESAVSYRYSHIADSS